MEARPSWVPSRSGEEAADPLHDRIAPTVPDIRPVEDGADAEVEGHYAQFAIGPDLGRADPRFPSLLSEWALRTELVWPGYPDSRTSAKLARAMRPQGKPLDITISVGRC